MAVLIALGPASQPLEVAKVALEKGRGSPSAELPDRCSKVLGTRTTTISPGRAARSGENRLF